MDTKLRVPVPVGNIGGLELGSLSSVVGGTLAAGFSGLGAPIGCSSGACTTMGCSSDPSDAKTGGSYSRADSTDEPEASCEADDVVIDVSAGAGVAGSVVSRAAPSIVVIASCKVMKRLPTSTGVELFVVEDATVESNSASSGYTSNPLDVLLVRPPDAAALADVLLF
ncbi:hypothetical protein ATCC90586_002920 [Pythium insidiosum]|nr:hypothetical protein ATCC90586_002920 [Pythium insidiosum]